MQNTNIIKEHFSQTKVRGLPTAAILIFVVALIVVPGCSNQQESASDTPSRLPPVGAGGQVGCGENPKRVQRLWGTKPGVYKNFLVDGEWTDKTLVKIQSDDVTLKHCEVRNGTHNGVIVYADNVVIDSCKIHHLLKGSFAKQQDAHGISGTSTNLVIRNCEIFMVSGDAVQFSPDRDAWDNILIENCTFWTAPLEADAAGFKRGQRPGENGVDTKQIKKNPRSRMTIRNSLFWGWGEGQIQNMAALVLKSNVQVTVEGCVFRDNEICFRLRGPASKARGGARVTIQDCAVYESDFAIRMENKLRDLKIHRLGIGEGIEQKYLIVKGVVQLLFSVELEFQRELIDGNRLSAELRERFKNNGISLPQHAAFVQQNRKWLITSHKMDEVKQIYTVEKKLNEGKLNIYGIAGYENHGEYIAPSYEQVLKEGPRQQRL